MAWASLPSLVTRLVTDGPTIEPACDRSASRGQRSVGLRARPTDRPADHLSVSFLLDFTAPVSFSVAGSMWWAFRSALPVLLSVSFTVRLLPDASV